MADNRFLYSGQVSYPQVISTPLLQDSLIQLTDGIYQVKQEWPFIFLLHPNYFLRDVLTSASNSTDSQKYVVMEEVFCQHLQQVYFHNVNF